MGIISAITATTATSRQKNYYCAEGGGGREARLRGAKMVVGSSFGGVL